MTLTAPTGMPERAPSTAAPSEAVGAYKPGFDGMRAIAMIVILAYHSDLPHFRGAFLGLSQFFTLSGFLITSILLRREARGGIHLPAFWAKRFRRLMPAALACLAMVMVFGATVADYQQAKALPAEVFAAATYWVNWLFIIQKTSYVGLFSSPSPVQHFWSLAIEEQFYLIMPVGMYLLFKRTRSLKVLGAILGVGILASTGWMAYLYHSGADFDRVYYGTDTRGAEMLVGSLLAVVLFHRGLEFSERAKRVIAVASTIAFAFTMWALSSVTLGEGPIWTGGMLAFSLVSSTVILGVLADRGPAAWILRLRPLPDMGRLTYGLYLYHWPIFLWLTADRTNLSAAPLFALRTATTFLVAIASYQLIEKGIREGGRIVFKGKAQYAVAPLVMVLIISGTYATAGRSAEDPLATLRADDSSLIPPLQPTDGVLDLLVITYEKESGVVDRIEKIAQQGTEVRVTRAAFGCSKLVADAKGASCPEWTSSWSRLVADHDPDVVLFYVDGWPAADIARLSGRSELESGQVAEQALGRGFDVLTSRGARVVFASSGAEPGVQLSRATQPFFQAMAELEATRSDIRHVLGERLPDKAKVTREEFVQRSAQALVTDASLYQRSGGSNLTRVLVVGDSQARSLGYGLERWGAQERRAIVWNTAIEGCGIVQKGLIRSGRTTSRVAQRCIDAAAEWSTQVAQFDPDVVIVLSSIWDMSERRVAGWKTFHQPGDAAYDRFLVNEYAAAVDTLTKGGAKVVWVKAPCIQVDPATQASALGQANAKNIVHLDDTVLPALARARADQVELFDLYAILCPGGRYLDAIDGVDPIRSDGTHFSVEGSLWFADSYGEQILRLAGH